MKKPIAKRMAAMIAAMTMALSGNAMTASAVDLLHTIYTMNTSVTIREFPYISCTRADWELDTDEQIAEKKKNAGTDNYLYGYVTIYSNQLDENGHLTKIYTLSEDSNEEAELQYDPKYIWVAVRVQGGPPTSKNDYKAGYITYYVLNPETYQWKLFGGWNGAAGSYTSVIYDRFKSKATTSHLDKAFEGFQEMRVYHDADADGTYTSADNICTVSQEQYQNDWMRSHTGAQSFTLPSDQHYLEYYWETDAQKVIDYGYAKQTIDYTFFGNFAGEYMYMTAKKSKSVIDLGPVIPKKGETFPDIPIPENKDVPVCPENLEPVIPLPTDPAVITDPADLTNHGSVYLIKNADVIEEYSASDFDNCMYYVPDYDEDATYFLAIETNVKDGDCDYNIYRWSPTYRYWEFRVNTEGEKATVPISPTAYPYENAKVKLCAKDTSYEQMLKDNGYEVDETNIGQPIGDWSKKDFNSGTKTAEIDPENFLPGQTFYTTFFDYKTDGGAYYRYIGIDPVLVETYGNRDNDPAAHLVPTNAHVGDTVTVAGTDDDGIPYQYDVYIADKGNVPVRDGESVLTDNDTMIFAEIEVKDGGLVSPQVDVVNLVDPEEASRFTVTHPNGTLMDAGNINDDAFDHVDDLNFPKSAFDEDAIYHGFTTEIGILNSADPNAKSTDKGYFTINDDGSLNLIHPRSDLKGDVDLDGDVDVADIVMLQKYLLNAQPFNIENYINADVYTEGKVDVFDLGMLKRIVVNQK